MYIPNEWPLPIKIGSKLTIENTRVKVFYIQEDATKKIIRAKSRNNQRYQFIIFHDNIVSKIYKFMELPQNKRLELIRSRH